MEACVGAQPIEPLWTEPISERATWHTLEPPPIGVVTDELRQKLCDEQLRPTIVALRRVRFVMAGHAVEDKLVRVFGVVGDALYLDVATEIELLRILHEEVKGDMIL